MTSMDIIPPPPHVVMLPFSAQGHIKPMLMLAELFCHANFHVTFVNMNHNHDRLLRQMDNSTAHRRLRFLSIPEGLPVEHPRNLPVDLLQAVRSVSKPKFKDLVVSLSGEITPPTCIIADSIMSFAIDVGEELEIPVITFSTISACCTWTDFHILKLIEQGEIPFPGDENREHPVTSIPGLESLLRQRGDLPEICRLKDLEHPLFKWFINKTLAMTRASGLILNTFEELESLAIGQLNSVFPKIYAIGPLHALLKAQIRDYTPPSNLGTLMQQDRTSLTWLDSQPSKSVVYVSFGSWATLTRDQLIEFWHGLVNSEKPFLWVIRPDMMIDLEKVEDEAQTKLELTAGTRERGFIVEWAPQEDILAHRAVGGFVTHGGWNSVIESIFAGVPMICCPKKADQHINSRCVSELWRIGLGMEDTCDRSTVEKMVREVMEHKSEEDIVKSAGGQIARVAHDGVNTGGSSHRNLEKLTDEIKSIQLARFSSQAMRGQT